MFTEEQLIKAKELSYKNLEKEETDIGFAFNGMWITNPFLEESGRFEFTNENDMYKYYGKENVISFINEILKDRRK